MCFIICVIASTMLFSRVDVPGLLRNNVYWSLFNYDRRSANTTDKANDQGTTLCGFPADAALQPFSFVKQDATCGDFFIVADW